VRENVDGTLVTHAFGRLVACNADPVEKKPLYHVLPGARVLSIATIGCNFRCDFCQNWQISQTHDLPDNARSGYSFSPEQLVETAEDQRCAGIAYTYTEPTIFFEYAFETAKRAARAGMINIFVTNGYMTRDALSTVAPYLDACNVDLKSFRDEFYRSRCGARLQPVLDSIRAMREMDIWTEVTTLVVPGRNDSPEELEDIARFIADVDRDIPWHLSRFYPQYKLHEPGPTPVTTLEGAREAGLRQGLRYVYLGNVPGPTPTSCARCGSTVVQREGYRADPGGLIHGTCRACGFAVAGRWRR
jgi:pyruvate formate lyase activating enzyme